MVNVKREGGTNADIELRRIALMAGLPQEVLHGVDCADYLALQTDYRRLRDVRVACGLSLRETDEAIEIPLWRPLVKGAIETTSLRMRRPTVGDLVSAQTGASSEADAEMLRHCHLCEQPPDVLGDLDFADYLALDEAFTRFLSSRPRMLAAR